MLGLVHQTAVDDQAPEQAGVLKAEAGAARVHSVHVYPASPLLHGNLYIERPINDLFFHYYFLVPSIFHSPVPYPSHSADVAAVPDGGNNAHAEVERVDLLGVGQQEVGLEGPAQRHLGTRVVAHVQPLGGARFMLFEVENLPVDEQYAVRGVCKYYISITSAFTLHIQISVVFTC